MLYNERFSTLLPGLVHIMGGGVQVLVMDCDYENALEILQRNEARDQKYCPCCGSTDIYWGLGKRKGVKAFFVALSALFAAPLGNICNVCQCRQCKAEFSVPAEAPPATKIDRESEPDPNDENLSINQITR